MRITDIRVHIVHAKHDNWIFTKVYTDEGITGVGESSLEGKEHVVVAAIQSLRSYLIGKNPFEAEKHFYVMFRDAYWGACAMLTGALSAIDGALWDIKGKALGVPVYELLGGKFRDRVRVYANRWFFGADTPEQLAEKAASIVAQGFTALKWDPFGKAEWSISRRQLDEVLRAVEAVKAAVGTETDIIIEGHGRFDVSTAVQIARELEPYRPLFFEEPVMPENVDALAEVKAKSTVPIAAGERLYTKHDFRQALEKRSVDVIQPDLRVTGGILETKKIAAMAEAYFIPVAPHNIHGRVGTAMTLQLLAAIPNAMILEYNVDGLEWEEELFSRALKPENGYLSVPDDPGLGIDFDDRIAEKHPYRPISMIQDMFDQH